jgi:hypothetical protein
MAARKSDGLDAGLPKDPVIAGNTLIRGGAEPGRGVPNSDRLMADSRKRRIDVVLVARFDRFARSVRQVVLALEEFRSLGIDFVSLHEGCDTSTPKGRLVFGRAPDARWRN